MKWQFPGGIELPPTSIMGRTAKTSQYSVEENAFWGEFTACAGMHFSTLKGLEFTFDVRGNEVFFDRKAKSVTRATVMMAYRRAKELSGRGVAIESPKQLGGFGASYIYPVFRYLGILAFNDGADLWK